MCEEREHNNYLRLISLLLDIGTESVYKLFIFSITTTKKDVALFLSHNRNILQSLIKRRILSKKQYGILTRTFQNAQNAEKFDISLLIILLSNLFSGIIEPPKTRWENNKPKPSDLTLGADLVRLRTIRNKILGHLPRARLSNYHFEVHWTNLKEILVRICKATEPTKEFEVTQNIEHYRTKNLDPQAEHRYKSELEDLRRNGDDVIISQEKVEKLIAESNEFEQFFRETPKRYLRYIRLLLEGGQLVLLAFLEKECTKQGQDLKALIKEKRRLLQTQLDNSDVWSQLEKKPKQWDLIVLATVILVLFGDKIKPKKAELVRHILDARKDYSESALESLNEGRFAPRCENLAYSLRTLSSSLGEDIEAKCKEYINREVDDITNDYYAKLLSMHGLKIKSLSNIYQEKMQDLKKSVQTMKEAGIEFSEEQVLELKIVILGGNEEKKKLVEDELTMVLKATIKDSENPHKFADVRRELENLLGPIKRSAVIRAEDIEQKCIILSIRCTSCHAVIELLDYIGSTLFQEHFFYLSDELSTLYGDLFVISACLTLDSLYTSLIKAGDMQRKYVQPLSKHAGDRMSANVGAAQQSFSEDLSKKGFTSLLSSSDVEVEMTSHSEPMKHIQEDKFKHVDKGVKVFNDSVHGLIELHPLCVEIINTPEFERLRFIKQLGASYFVYPGAAHNRFEHSIGVCYLAGKLVEAIRKRQPELQLTDEDVLCVQIAGLCHDMGHGPFSHVFDNVVLPKLVEGTTWKHEKGSVDMFSYMRKNNPALAARFKEYGIEEKEIDFINELIFGPNGQDYSNWLKTTTKGKSENKNERTHVFLYEVVNNKRNEIDVDKWDYFARDCYMLGMGISFDYKRCIAFSRVLEVNGEWQICYRDKEYNNLLEMFEIRYQLHRRAYKHKTVNGIEMMIAEALVAAHKHITFIGTGGSAKKMSETIEDMAAFSLMTDEVFYRILNDPNPELKTSQELLLRVLRRDIYLQVAEKPCGPDTYDKETVKREIREIMHVRKGEEPFEIDIVNLNYGRGIKNPVSYVNFYKKDNINHAEPIHEEDVSRLLPKKWAEMHVRIYSKNKENREAVREAFMKWKMQ